jgi:N-glycosyltransferase
VPQVLVPLSADETHNAERVAAIGAGLRADPRRPETIRAAVERVLHEPSFRAAAAAVARESFALPPIDAVASSVRELVASARETRAA